MKKKKIVIIVLIVILIIMLVPIKNRLYDGGTTEYKSLLYTYTRLHRISEISFTGYEEGWELRILGIRVGGNINTDKSNRSEEIGSIFLSVKEETRTSKGATFVIKNNTNMEYAYGESYMIEKFYNKSWEYLNTLTKEPLTWNQVLYYVKPGEEKEVNIDWSNGYGELKSGTYRIVKSDFRKVNSPDSRAYTVYSEFDIK